MKEKLNLKTIAGFVGACLFALSMMISHIPSDAFATDPGSDPEVSCKGSMQNCASHLPGRLP